jgi:hypothetical protein
VSSQGPQYLTTHKPSGVVGGLLATITRHRCFGSVERFQPIMNRYWDEIGALIEHDQVVRMALEPLLVRLLFTASYVDLTLT